jgi:hypothetical protein
MLLVIPIFYALAWGLAYHFLGIVSDLPIHESVLRSWQGSDPALVQVNRIALLTAAVAYGASWAIRLKAPKDWGR